MMYFPSKWSKFYYFKDFLLIKSILSGSHISRDLRLKVVQLFDCFILEISFFFLQNSICSIFLNLKPAAFTFLYSMGGPTFRVPSDRWLCRWTASFIEDGRYCWDACLLAGLESWLGVNYYYDFFFRNMSFCDRFIEDGRCDACLLTGPNLDWE